ncbi:hypothetical protein O181_095830 [Austropuccinia psidii MF-1]|uniref:HAT C-terminal dimerisation domain-containing protein n=1 Tax=Austropuccinia psidii MF-1 TaxID=1389203 RepID=A0A9Q3PCG0_9BASI|nr:hypothetical protein [Austropuccinia psidii MF-1]
MVCIMTDNASVNHQMVHEISRQTSSSFSAEVNAIGCMAHVLHLVACDGLKALGNSSPVESSPANEPRGPMDLTSLIDPPEVLSLNYYSIISRVACLALYLHQSPQRCKRFITTVKLVYNDTRPTNATTLLSHVSTCWNSTYNMLERALSLKYTYNQYCTFKNMQAYQLSPLEWEKMKLMVQFLQPLYQATTIICGSKYPTINQALPLYILLMKRINQACLKYNVAPIEPEASSMTNKLTKYLTLLLKKIPVICASILDPWLKMKFFITHNSTLEDFGTSAKELESIFEREACYHLTSSNESSQLPQPSHEQGSALIDEIYPMAHPEANTVENEIQQYFAEPPEVKTTDVLLFWKSQASMFPTLKKMACKYLAIPATSAPSEQLFSCGHKILTYQFASLSSMHVEQLSCLRDWARQFGPIYSQT